MDRHPVGPVGLVDQADGAITNSTGGAGLGMAGLGASEAQVAPGPFPQQWCPGEYWDPGWGNNWDWGRCHDNWQGPGGPGWGPNGAYGPGWGPGGPGPGWGRVDRLRLRPDLDGDLTSKS